MNTEQSLLSNNKIMLLEPFTTAKAHHLMKCLMCQYEWTATPLSKKQTFKKYGVSGCPECKKLNNERKYAKSRVANLEYLLKLGIVPIDDWDGRRSFNNKPISVHVKNIHCGHEFECTSANLLSRGITCAVCGKATRASQLTQTSLDRSAIWQETAPEWLAYKARVVNLTRVTYHQHKHTINPDNLPRGIAGTDGAYQLDHIVPIRWCFEHSVPEELAAHHTNLQIIPWLENVSEGGSLKVGVDVPSVLNAFL